jgi:hypothetical protein
VPYTERYVAFLDILGFGDIIKQSETDATPVRVDALAKALAEVGSLENPLDHIAPCDFRFQSFSDSIVVSTDSTSVGLMALLASINKLTLKLLTNGLLIRGAIAKGKLHHDNFAMFGPAFLEAYRIEQTIAGVPRVILSRDTYGDVQHHVNSLGFGPKVLLDDDGPPYLDVLASLPGETPDTTNVCQRIIQQLLDVSIHTPKHYAKLRWLTIYWNSTVARSDPLRRITFPNSPPGT